MSANEEKKNNESKSSFFTTARIVILCVIGVFGILGLSYFLYIKITGNSIPCFYYTNFGIQCPGCGLTRMFLSLSRLDFVSAFKYNPFMFCVLSLWTAVGTCAFIGKPKFAVKPWVLYSLLGATALGYVVFGVLRNI